MSDANIGSLCSLSSQKDAVHMAIAPVTAATVLAPAERVKLNGDWQAISCMSGSSIGIVDPFLSQPVKPGETFWLFLYPKTITGLRHDWYHPAFPVPATGDGSAEKAISRAWLTEFASKAGLTLDELLEHCDRAAGSERPNICLYMNDDYELLRRLEDESEAMWSHYRIVSGKTTGRAPTFSCSC